MVVWKLSKLSPTFIHVLFTGFLSEIGTKLHDWAVGQAGGQLLLLGNIVLK